MVSAAAVTTAVKNKTQDGVKNSIEVGCKTTADDTAAFVKKNKTRKSKEKNQKPHKKAGTADVKKSKN